MAGITRHFDPTKENDMTVSTRTQFASLFAAVVCAFITVGFSVAPAIAPLTA
jgi:hypothetical protein